MIEIALFSFLEFGKDMLFVLKIFMLLAIISFVWQHLGKGPVAIVIIIGLAYIVLLSPFAWFFEATYVLMTLLMFGVGGVLIDFVFAFPGIAAGGAGAPEGQISSGKDMADRNARFMAGRQRLAAQKPRLPPPM